MKGNQLLCYVLIFRFVGIYGLQWKHMDIICLRNIYEYFNARQALKEVYG